MNKYSKKFGNELEYSKFLADDDTVLNECVERLAENLVRAVQLTGRMPIEGMDVKGPFENRMAETGSIGLVLKAEARNDANGLMFGMMTALTNALGENINYADVVARLRGILRQHGIAEYQPDED